MPLFDKTDEYYDEFNDNFSFGSDSHKWRLIVDDPTGMDGKLNMATDKALLMASEMSLVTVPTLRIYSWSRRTLSIGYGQKEEDFVFRNAGPIDVVKRITGGRALVHGSDLSYAFVCPKKSFKKFGTNLRDSYCAISEALASGLKGIGIEVSSGNETCTGKENNEVKLERAHIRQSCFASVSPFEQVVKSADGYKKISGNAQRRLKNSFIQHGSIMIGSSGLINEEVFGKNFSGGTTDASAETGENPEELMYKLTHSIIDGFKRQFGVEFISAGYAEIEDKLRYNLDGKVSSCNLPLKRFESEKAYL